MAMGSSTQNPGETDGQMGEQDDAGDMDMGHVGSLEPAFDDFVSEMLLMSLASSGRKYGRETRAAHRRIVSEVYSRRGSRPRSRGAGTHTSYQASRSTSP